MRLDNLDAPTSTSLNVTRNYARNMDLTQALCEIITNAMDASPESHVVDYCGPILVVTTPTCPTPGQLFAFGESTKTEDATTIGQFGEGFKMAYLAFAHLGLSASIEVCDPPASIDCTITFELRDTPGYATPLLYAIATPGTNDLSQGCRCTIDCGMDRPNPSDLLKGKFLETDTPFLDLIIEKENSCTPPRIHVKGVYHQALTWYSSLFDYNLCSLAISRDRKLVSTSDVATEVRKLIVSRADPTLFATLLQYSSDTDEIFEWECLAAGTLNPVCKDILLTCFTEAFGEKAVLAMEDSWYDPQARTLGYKLIHAARNARTVLNRAGVKTSQSIGEPKTNKIETIPSSEVPTFPRMVAIWQAVFDWCGVASSCPSEEEFAIYTTADDFSGGPHESKYYVQASRVGDTHLAIDSAFTAVLQRTSAITSNSPQAFIIALSRLQTTIFENHNSAILNSL